MNSLPTHLLWIRLRPALALVTGLALSLGSLSAQSQPTGEIAGRVLNVSSGNYLNNARLVVEGTNLETYSNDVGEYRLQNVPVGEVRLGVSFVGFERQTVVVTVRPGGVTTQDFSLVIRRASGSGDVVELEAFTVEDREMTGVGIALHEQRIAPNIKSVVSLDEFGDMGEGNVGEFLKYVPGVDIVYSPTNPQYATVRGMPASGTLVTFDGMIAASSAAGDTRQFDLATAASGNVDRLEVTKTPTPDMPANAVGGAINVISKSGFSRSKPLFRYELFTTYTSLSGVNHLDRRWRNKAGLENRSTGSAVQPGANLSYILPINKSVALSLAATHSTRNDDRLFLTPTWNRVTLLQTQNQMNNLVGGGGMQLVSAGVDWKVAPQSLIRASFSRSYRPGFTRQYVFRTTAGANATGGPTYYQGAPNGVGTAVQAPALYHYSRDLDRFALSYRYDGSNWRVDASASYSSGAWIRNDVNEDFFGGLSATLSSLVVRNDGLDGIHRRRVPVVTAVNQQGQSVDVFNGQLLSVTSASSTQQLVESEALNAALNVARNFEWRVPVTFKTGFLFDRQSRERADRARSWTFNPPGGTAGRLASNFDLIETANSERWYFTDVNGARVQPQWLSPAKLFALYQTNPTWFALNETAAHTSEVNGATKLDETITAGYIRVDARFLENRLWIVAGVRYEHTNDKGRGPLNDIWAVYVKNPDGTLARNAAGQLIPITTNAVERTKLQYQKLGSYSNTSYDGYYPSFNASYNLSEDVVLRAAYARTIGRPNLNLIIPSTTITDPDASDTNRTINIVNGRLAPWTANNYDLTAEAYNIKGAVASVSLFQKDIENFHASSRTSATPELLEEFGLPMDYIDYDIITNRNAGNATIRGIEFAYRQSLSFLPSWGKGIQVFGNVTSLDLSGANAALFSEFSPRNINWGVSYARPRFLAKLNIGQTKWVRRSAAAANASTPAGSYTYRAPQTRIGVSLEYRFTRKFTLYASAKNLMAAPVRNMIYHPDLPEYARPSNFQHVPAEFTLGVKGEF